jgi:hypothetical protein
MRQPIRIAACALLLGLASPALAQTAIELKKDLLPKIKKAQAEGKDLGAALDEYNQGDKALKDGLQDEAADHFKKAKAAMPAEGK